MKQSSVTMSDLTTLSASDLRRLLRQVPDASLSSAVESLRAAAFVQFSLRLARALESSLRPAAIREPTHLNTIFIALTTTWASALESVPASSR